MSLFLFAIDARRVTSFSCIFACLATWRPVDGGGREAITIGAARAIFGWLG